MESQKSAEREAIVNEFDRIKKVVESSSLKYFFEESPYTAKIHLRKKFRNNWFKQANKSSTSLHASTPLIGSSPFTSRPSPRPNHQTFSFNESAYQTQSIQQTTFHDAAIQKNDAEYDLAKLELLEARQTIVKLRDEIRKKDILISQTGLNLKKIDEEKDVFKKDRDTKGEQLKQKNKLLNEAKEKLAKVKEEHETIKGNYEHKINNLIKKNENSNIKLQNMNTENKQLRKQDRIEIKKITKDNEKKQKEIDTLKHEIKNLKIEPLVAPRTTEFSFNESLKANLAEETRKNEAASCNLAEKYAKNASPNKPEEDSKKASPNKPSKNESPKANSAEENPTTEHANYNSTVNLPKNEPKEDPKNKCPIPALNNDSLKANTAKENHTKESPKTASNKDWLKEIDLDSFCKAFKNSLMGKDSPFEEIKRNTSLMKNN